MKMKIHQYVIIGYFNLPDINMYAVLAPNISTTTLW